MKCPSKTQDGETRLLNYATARFHGRDSAELTAHLHDCQNCAAFVNAQRAVWDLLDIWDPEPTSMGFDRVLYARIEQSRPRTFWDRVTFLWSGWVARPALPLAVASLLVVAGIALERPLTRGILHSSANSSPEEVAPVDGEQFKQLNKAFDDLQFLYQLDVVKDEAPKASRPM